MMATAAPAFSAWLDSFFGAYYRRRPVNATFIGVHTYDDDLPDLSDRGIADTLSEAEALLEGLRGLPDEPLDHWQRLDRQLAEGFLRIQQWESTSLHFGSANPVQFTGEAIFGLVSLLLRPTPERLQSASARLEKVRAFLQTGTDQVRSAPAAWIQRARHECEGARVLMDDVAITFPSLRDATRRAAAAFAEFE
ncbi:MAG TPA: DUF885 family protein, partial [Chloroflexota bacterium]